MLPYLYYKAHYKFDHFKLGQFTWAQPLVSRVGP